MRDEVEACIVEFGGGRVRSEEKEIKSESLGHAGVYSLAYRIARSHLSLGECHLASEARWRVG